MPELHQLDAAGHLAGLVLVDRIGPPGPRGAEPAAAGAHLAQNHEGSRPPAPAFGLVGALSAAANRVQVMFPDDALDPRKGGIPVKTDLQPVGFFRYVPQTMQLRHFKFIIFLLSQK